MGQKLYYGGTVLTMQDSMPQAEAVLVEDGKIRAVGPYTTLLEEAPQAQKVDLKGHTILPGFIDPHSHFTSYAVSLLQPSVEHCTCFEDIVQVLEQHLQNRRIPAGQWVTMKKFDQTALQEGVVPDRSILDKVAPNHPVLLQHQSGHTGVLNTKGLEVLGITPDTPVPEGGKIECIDGRLTGYVEENALMEIIQKIPMPSMQELEQAYLQAQDCYASYGITTMQEGMMMDMMADLFSLLCHKKLLKLDLVGYVDFRSSEELLSRFAKHQDQYCDHFKIGGYKTFLDGSPQARTAWLRKPYENAENGYCGYPTLTDAQLLEYVLKALREGRQLLAHCNGDAAAEQYLRVLNKAIGQMDDVPYVRPVMVHAQLLAKDQLKQVKQLGVIPSFFVAHIYYWGDVHVRNLGMQRAKNISCAGDALREGILFTFHQDAPVIQPNMMETIQCAVTRKTKSGVCLGEMQKISVEQALKAVTIHAAYQYFEEQQKGSIEVGKCADFVILEKNPFNVPIDQIREIRILETIKDGSTVYQA